MSELADGLLVAIGWLELPAPVLEYRFAAEYVGGTGKGLRQRLKDAGLKDWRFDFAWLDRKVALEVNGGQWLPGGGRHNRGSGNERDIEKLNSAQMLGWKVYQVTTNMVKDGRAMKLLEQVLK